VGHDAIGRPVSRGRCHLARQSSICLAAQLFGWARLAYRSSAAHGGICGIYRAQVRSLSLNKVRRSAFSLPSFEISDFKFGDMPRAPGVDRVPMVT
jgi:hypothetical protein